MQCLFCQEDISKNHFPQHLKRHHDISKDAYKTKFNLHNFCACGCGTKIKDKLKWAHGHHSRVNNISKRPDIREKRRKFLKLQHASGLRPEIWNKGLTKETDERVAQYGASQSENCTQGQRNKKSKNMKRLWQEGKIKPLFGAESRAWKGGTSTLVQRLRADNTLYKEWKYPILKRDNFSCTECVASGALEVHHDQEKMSEILARFVNKDSSERTFDEDSILVGRIVQYHIDNQVSGITLCKKCHKNLHDSYNF